MHISGCLQKVNIPTRTCTHYLEMAVPTGGKRIHNLSEFVKQVSNCSHIAVFRPFLKIYHHYLVIEVQSDSMIIIHNIGGALKTLTARGFAEILEEKIKFTITKDSSCKLVSEHLDFDAGLYLIERSGYPSTEEENEYVIKRARTRLGEKDFKFSSKNCEWFVTWAITGIGKCEQIENAGKAERMLADVLDGTVCNYRSATAKTVIDQGLEVSAYAMQKVAASSAITGSGAAIATGCLSAAVTAAPAIEIVAAGVSVKTLYKKWKKKQIDSRTFRREYIKKVSGTSMSIGGGIIGATVGQICFPVPIVGAIIGGVVGSLVGRGSGVAAAGIIHDKLT
ncbi:unnamed protein product [Mytilus coruscus]|uniref:LRAT domain-containing protein n=1 Tax=Mytilus coruscus TaxID=42192 RepID=A0A6J8F3U8_MYTCO|nr:unnamed protein product [Mytilus coruscus]